MDFSPMHLWQSMTWIAQGVAIIAGHLLRVLAVRDARALAVLQEGQEAVARFRQAGDRGAGEGSDPAGGRRGAEVPRQPSGARHPGRTDRISARFDPRRIGPLGHDLVEAARRAIERETLITYSDFKKGIGALATIATTAPFIGLFGTVVGIINAFRGMSSGAGGIAAVSGGIAEALVTTALGLFVAIPAAWMFNYFTGVLERFSVEMSNSSSELVDFFIKKHGGSDAVGVRV